MASESEFLSDKHDDVTPPPTSATRVAASLWQQRVLQLDGKRYSLRLECAFWSALEAIARRRKLRLNRLVADIASGRPAESNLSSILRVYCLGEVERAAGALDGYRRPSRRRAGQKSLA